MSVDYLAVLADLDEQISKLTVARDAIREMIAARGGTGALPLAFVDGQAPKGTATKPPRKARKGTIASAAYEIIRASGDHMKVADLVKALQAMGRFRTNDARSNYGSVYKTLIADSRFIKSGQGSFDIRDRAKFIGQPTQMAAVTRGEA